MVITQNGEAKMVVMGVEEYDRMRRALGLLKIIQLSEVDVRKGRTIPQEYVFQKIEAVIDEARHRQSEKTS